MTRPLPLEISLEQCRHAIERCDARIGSMLEQRAALTRQAQEIKAALGIRGRDAKREAHLAARLATHAPSLGVDGAAAVMAAIIDACLADVQEHNGHREMHP